MKSHIEKSKYYELDKYLIKKIYNVKDKKELTYKMNKKNVVYDKELTDKYYKYSNNNRNNYYSSYQSFRDYISTGYNYEFLVNEINNVKSILGFSRNIRNMISKKLKSDNISQNNQDINLLNIPFEEKKQNDMEIIRAGRDNYGRKKSAVFQIDHNNPHRIRTAKYSHKKMPNQKEDKKDFIEMCKLLKIKNEELKYPQKQYQFRLFSVFTEDFDPFYLPIYENFTNVKYDNQKKKLIKLYNQEKKFINCVTLVKKQLKSYANKDKNIKNDDNQIKGEFGSDKHPQDDCQLKIPQVNALFLGRTESYFKDIDNFMNMYKENTSLATKRQEKDFFENLFKILTYNNTDCNKFLQYLYSHSYFFKYIYNIFTIQNKIVGTTIKNFAPSIKRQKEDAPFLEDSMKKFFFNEDTKHKMVDPNKILLNRDISEKEEGADKEGEFNDYMDELIGNEFIYQISIFEEDITEYIAERNINFIETIISNPNNFNPNYIITLNNKKNTLDIVNIKQKKEENHRKSNMKKKEILFSAYFDEKIIFYDIENEVINNMELDKEIYSNDKFIIVGYKQNEEDLSSSYIFKISNEIFERFNKSLISKGIRLRNRELFGEKDNSDIKNLDDKLNFEDIMNEAHMLGHMDKKDSNKKWIEHDSDSDKKEKGIKNQLTFGSGLSFKKNNLNETEQHFDEDLNKYDVKDSSANSEKKEENEDDKKEIDNNNKSDSEDNNVGNKKKLKEEEINTDIKDQ